MAKLDTYIKIDVEGNAAVASLGRLEKAAQGVDDQIEDIGGDDKLGRLQQGADGLTSKMAALAGPAAIGAVGAGLFKLADGFANTAIEAGTMATALDLSVEDASRLNAAFSSVGLEMNDTVDIALQITGALQDNAELAATLGFEVGQVVEPIEALRAGIDRWDFLTPTQRAQAFGEEGVRQISRLVSEGATLDEILSEVNPGQIIDEEELRKAQEFKETTAEIKALWESVVVTIGGPLAGAIAEAADADNWRGIIGGGKDASDTIAELWGNTIKQRDAAYEAAAAADSMRRETYAAGQEGAEAIKEVTSAYDRLTGKLDDRSSWLSLQDSIDEVKNKGIAAYEAGVEGADNAAAANRAYEQSMIDLTQETLDYLTQVLEIPEDVATDIALSYSGKTPDQVEADLERLTRQRTIRLLFKVPETPRFIAAPGASSSVTNNVTINASRTLSGRELSQLSQDWARVNG